MIKLTGIGHVNLRVADQEDSKRFYRDVLGFRIAEEDPDHGGVFMTLGENFHTLDIGQHPSPENAPRPQRGQIGLAHIAFQVASYAALREAYAHLVEHGVPILRAANHVNQRSFYFADPDGNVLEIYYEMPYALDLFANGRSDEDEALPVSGPGEPLPQWLLDDWPSADMKAQNRGCCGVARNACRRDRRRPTLAAIFFRSRRIASPLPVPWLIMLTLRMERHFEPKPQRLRSPHLLVHSRSLYTACCKVRLSPQAVLVSAPAGSGSAEHDVKRASEGGRLDFAGGSKRHDEPGASGGVPDAHQYPVALVERLAGNVHLRGEPVEPCPDIAKWICGVRPG